MNQRFPLESTLTISVCSADPQHTRTRRGRFSALLRAGLASSALLCSLAGAQSNPGGPVGAGGNPGDGYRGPGDTVPSGGGSTSTGGGAPVFGVVPGAGATGTPGNVPVVRPRIPPPGFPGSPWNAPEETPHGRPSITDETSWQHWWHHNRWAYLDAEGGVLDRSVTGSGGFFLGRGTKQDDSGPLRANDADLLGIVQPALVAAASDADQPELASQALLALGKVRGLDVSRDQRQFWQVVPRLLKHPNQSVVERSVLALGVRGDVRFLRWLESILANEPDGQARLGGGRISDRVRAFAAYGLGLLGERSPDPVIRTRVHAALSRAMRSDLPEVEGAAIVAAGHVSLPWEADPSLGGRAIDAHTRWEQIDELLAYFENPKREERLRGLVPTALARLAGESEEARTLVAERLLEALAPEADPRREVQLGAVLALGVLGTSGPAEVDRNIHRLLEQIATRSGYHRVARYAARIALAQTASRPGAGETPYVGLEPVRELLVKQLTRSRGQSMCWTALALGILERDAAVRGEMPSPAVTGGLRRMLERNKTPEVAGAAAIALGLIRDIESVPALATRMLDTGETHVRGYTALALGMIGARDQVERVHAVLADAQNQPFALQQASIGLGLLREEATGAFLFSLLDEASDPMVQSSIASGLGWLRDPRPLGPLASRVKDADLGSSARSWAAVAMGRIADRDPWPWVARWSVACNYGTRLVTLVDEDFQAGLLDLP